MTQGFEGGGGVEYPAGPLPNLLWEESWGQLCFSHPRGPIMKTAEVKTKKKSMHVGGKTGYKNLEEFCSSFELLEWFFPLEGHYFLVFFFISSLSGSSLTRGMAKEGDTF